MKISRWTGAGMIVMAVLLCASQATRADVYTPSAHGRTEIPTIKSADDAVSSVPVLSRLTRSFLVGDGFKFKLSGTELRVDHMATDSSAPVSQRNCMISLNFNSPVAFFGSSVELPLLHASNVGSNWGTSSFGDYVAHFSKDASVEHPTIGLKVTARF
jgi:hypothetical protein